MKKTRLSQVFIEIFSGLLFLIGCDSEVQKSVDIGPDYFPLQKGVYQIYKIEEIIHSGSVQPETLRYELRAEITDSFPSVEGNYTYVMHRKKRDKADTAWRSFDTWSVRKTDRECIVTEGNYPYLRPSGVIDQLLVTNGNTPYLKLALPLRTGNKWNGNKYNNLNEDEYEIVSLNEPLAAGDMIFGKTLMIKQEDNDDFVSFLDQRKEVYARQVGLISKEVVQLLFCSEDYCHAQQIIKYGRKYKQEIIEYGRVK